MAKEPKPEKPEAPAPMALPATGGAWIRLPDGSLIPDPAEHPPADPKESS